VTQPLPPPNRACGSPAHGSPVGGFTSSRVDRPTHRLRLGEQPMIGKGEPPPLTSTWRPSTCGWTRHPVRLGVSPVCIVPRTHRPVGVRVSVHRASTFLRPLAPRALPRFLATMGALTPDRLSATGQVSLIHVHGLPDHSVSNHLAHPRRRFNTLPLSAAGLPPSGRSRLRPSPAGSPDTPGRIEFVILRTGRSPPVASHPASRRRSYSRLQAGERIPGADLHRSDHAHSQAHRCGAQRRRHRV
jgi:hypothetical protein